MFFVNWVGGLAGGCHRINLHTVGVFTDPTRHGGGVLPALFTKPLDHSRSERVFDSTEHEFSVYVAAVATHGARRRVRHQKQDKSCDGKHPGSLVGVWTVA